MALAGEDVAPVEYSDMLGNTINTGYQVTDTTGPTTDTFSPPVISSPGYGPINPATGYADDTAQMYVDAAEKLPGELLKNLKDAINGMLPTVPWWVWVGGAGVLVIVLRKALK